MQLAGTLTSSSTLVVVALEQEARHFVVEHPVLTTGVGKVRAAVAGVRTHTLRRLRRPIGRPNFRMTAPARGP